VLIFYVKTNGEFHNALKAKKIII